jgi:hypothetical protein
MNKFRLGTQRNVDTSGYRCGSTNHVRVYPPVHRSLETSAVGKCPLSSGSRNTKPVQSPAVWIDSTSKNDIGRQGIEDPSLLLR